MKPTKKARGKHRSRPRAARPRRARTKAPATIPLAYNVRVADVLSMPPILVGTDATLLDAVMLMRTHNISGMPVIDASGKVVGVISQKDLAREVVGGSGFPEIKGLLDVLMVGLADQPASGLQKIREGLEETRVRDAMSSPPFVIHSDAPLEFAAEVMHENAINRLPVVDEGRLVGIVTRTDLVRAFVRFPQAKHPR